MPYEIKKKGAKFCVVKEGGEEVACHNTKAEAEAQRKALYANEDKAREFKAKERKKLAAKKQALSDGSFPIKTIQDLKNAIQAFGRAKNKARAKAHIIRRAKALKATNLLPADWAGRTDMAHEGGWLDCPEEDCGRKFLTDAALADHAEAVHTFSDIERIVAEAIRDKHGNYTSSNNRTYVWINDIADDWVVFTVEDNTKIDLFRSTYTILDGVVSLGDPVEVQRRTVYEPVKKD